LENEALSVWIEKWPLAMNVSDKYPAFETLNPVFERKRTFVHVCQKHQIPKTNQAVGRSKQSVERRAILQTKCIDRSTHLKTNQPWMTTMPVISSITP
jgi:hypothetical protein